MSKQLKDYLHLHLGCECWVQGQVEAHPIKLTGISYDDQVGEIWCYFENTETGYALLEDVKPILRPLPDMTDEEKQDVNAFSEMLSDHHAGEAMGATVLYLLSKHFDLFGLIDAGLAIDKTKQTQSHE